MELVRITGAVEETYVTFDPTTNKAVHGQVDSLFAGGEGQKYALLNEGKELRLDNVTLLNAPDIIARNLSAGRRISVKYEVIETAGGRTRTPTRKKLTTVIKEVRIEAFAAAQIFRLFILAQAPDGAVKLWLQEGSNGTDPKPFTAQPRDMLSVQTPLTVEDAAENYTNNLLREAITAKEIGDVQVIVPLEQQNVEVPDGHLQYGDTVTNKMCNAFALVRLLKNSSVPQSLQGRVREFTLADLLMTRAFTEYQRQARINALGRSADAVTKLVGANDIQPQMISALHRFRPPLHKQPEVVLPAVVALFAFSLFFINPKK